MSVLAGFDVVVEFSNAAIRDLIKANLRFGNVPANPPFEFTLPVAATGVAGSMHTIVTDAEVTVNANDTLTFTLVFGSSSGTSLALTSPVARTISLLAGSASVTAPIVLIPATVGPAGGKQIPSVATAQSTATVGFDAPSKAKLEQALSGSQLSYDGIVAALAAAATAYVKAIKAIPVGAAISVVPGKPGSLNPPRFETVEVHSIGTQALGLFGMLFPEKPTGNSLQKTGSALTAGHDVCISISEDAFHRLEFCPALVERFNVPDSSALPPTCGSAAGIDVENVTITSIGDSFGDGHVNIDGSLTKSGFCYDADGTFHGELTFTANGSTLIPSLALDDPDISVHIPWYCAPVQFVYEIFGYLQQIINGAIIQAVAGGLAQSAIDTITQAGLPSQQLGSISAAAFDEVAVTDEALTLNGSAVVTLPFPEEAGVALSGSVTTSNAVAISSGTRVAVVGFCPPREFPYTEYAQTQAANYELVPTLLGLPLRILWSIIPGDGSAAIPLNDPDVPSQGNVAIPSQTVEYPFPSPNGSIVAGVDIHVGYSTSGLGIQLANHPDEGNYAFTLKASVEDSRGKLLDTQTYVQFQGDAVVMGGGYNEFVSDCQRRFGDWLSKHSQAAEVTLPWVPVDFPAPDTLAAYVRMLWNTGTREAMAALGEAKLAHGSSFLRAISLTQTTELTDKSPLVTSARTTDG
jgi:hypothetical protein